MLGENPEDELERRAQPASARRGSAAARADRPRRHSARLQQQAGVAAPAGALRRPGHEPAAAGRDLHRRARRRHAASRAGDRHDRAGLAGSGGRSRRRRSRRRGRAASRSRWWDDVEDDLRARPGESVPIRVAARRPRRSTLQLAARRSRRAWTRSARRRRSAGRASVTRGSPPWSAFPTANAPANADRAPLGRSRRRGERRRGRGLERLRDALRRGRQRAATSRCASSALEDGKTEPATLE